VMSTGSSTSGTNKGAAPKLISRAHPGATICICGDGPLSKEFMGSQSANPREDVGAGPSRAVCCGQISVADTSTERRSSCRSNNRSLPTRWSGRSYCPWCVRNRANATGR
jgi:hypothetical protein